MSGGAIKGEWPRPLLLGHRGAGGVAPENTWPAFEAAREAGAHGFEIDVMLAKDGVPVVVHDLTLERIAGGEAAIQSLTSRDLADIDVGSHFHPSCADCRVPLLADVLDAYGDMILDLELKGLNPFAGKVEETVIKMVRARGMEDRVVISSFNPLIIRKVQALAPELRTGYNYLSDSILHLRRAWFGLFIYPYSKHPQPCQVSQSYLARQRRRGVRVIPWGVNDRAEMERLFRLGVDGMISDFPALLVNTWSGVEAGPA